MTDHAADAAASTGTMTDLTGRDLNAANCHMVFDLDLGTENDGGLPVGLPANAPV